MSLAEKRQAAGYLQESYPVSERRACRVLQLSCSSRRRRPGTPSQAALVQYIHDLSIRYPRFGYRKIAVLLRQAGWRVGRERVRLIRRQEGLQVIVKQKKKRPVSRVTMGRNWSPGSCRTGWLTSRWAPITLTRVVPGRTGPMKLSMRCFGTAV